MYQRWVKIEDRLPEQEDLVMVSCRPKDRPKCGPYIKIAYIHIHGPFFKWVDPWDIMNFVEDKYNIEYWCKITYPPGFSKKDRIIEETDRFEILDL